MLQMRVNKPSYCPACGERSLQALLYVKNDCDIRRCNVCGMGQTDTTGFDPTNYYTDEYFSGGRVDGAWRRPLAPRYDLRKAEDEIRD